MSTGDETMASKGRPYRTVSIEGYEVLIGKSAADNDRLTFDVAEPWDIWLHAGGGVAGSHVLVRNPHAQQVPHSVIKAAAALAAWYSKAKHARRVTVDYCLARDVSKPRGAPPGQVMIKRSHSVMVVPTEVNSA